MISLLEIRRNRFLFDNFCERTHRTEDSRVCIIILSHHHTDNPVEREDDSQSTDLLSCSQFSTMYYVLCMLWPGICRDTKRTFDLIYFRVPQIRRHSNEQTSVRYYYRGNMSAQSIITFGRQMSLGTTPCSPSHFFDVILAVSSQLPDGSW